MKCGFIKVASATPVIRVADTAYNAKSICAVMEEAAQAGTKLLVLPELCITGYTCGDLFRSQTLLNGADTALETIVAASAQWDMLTFVGLPVSTDGKLYNCAAAVYRGKLIGIVPKTNISNYAEFYEKRYFTAGDAKITSVSIGKLDPAPFGTNLLFRNDAMPALAVAAELCEDLWVPCPPSVGHAVAGATIIVNLSASNDTVGKADYRRQMVMSQSARLVCGYVYANAGEGESSTDVVYAGHNMIAENGELLEEHHTPSGMIITELDIQYLDSERRKLDMFSSSSSGYTTVNWGGAAEETVLTRKFRQNPFLPTPENMAKQCEEILNIQSLSLKHRMEHSYSKYAVVGVSGGLDSTLAILVTARTLEMMGLPKEHLIAVTMPCFGTTGRTKSNAVLLAEYLGASLRVVDIGKSVMQHFEDIGHDYNVKNVVFENAQARERTQVLMDIANGCSGLVIGTGDMSELALGWATYNGDHMSMYGLNASVTKTLVRCLVTYLADTAENRGLADVLYDILDTPVSPELLPAEEDQISQKTEDLVGPYELHDFFLYYLIARSCSPRKVFRLAHYVFDGIYDDETILKWLRTFCRRFFAQQFKRSCLPDGPKVGDLSLSPRGDWRMPSDASAALWLSELEGM